MANKYQHFFIFWTRKTRKNLFRLSDNWSRNSESGWRRVEIEREWEETNACTKYTRMKKKRKEKNKYKQLKDGHRQHTMPSTWIVWISFRQASITTTFDGRFHSVFSRFCLNVKPKGGLASCTTCNVFVRKQKRKIGDRLSRAVRATRPLSAFSVLIHRWTSSTIDADSIVVVVCPESKQNVSKRKTFFVHSSVAAFAYITVIVQLSSSLTRSHPLNQLKIYDSFLSNRNNFMKIVQVFRHHSKRKSFWKFRKRKFMEKHGKRWRNLPLDTNNTS